MDDPVQALLLRFGIDLSPAKAAAEEIKKILASLNQLSDEVDSKGKRTAQTQKAALDQLKAAAQAAIVSSKAAATGEAAKAAALKTQTEELKKQNQEQANVAATAKAGLAIAQQKKAETAAEVAEIQKIIQERKAETAEIQKQLAELRKKKVEEREHGHGEHGGHEEHEGLLGSITKGLLGQGLAGGIAGGIVAGAGIGVVATSVYRGLEHLVEELREITVEASGVTQLEDQFKKLAAGGGKDADEVISSMREHTDGLIGKFALLKVQTAGLKSNIGLTTEEISKLSGAVVRLADVGGKDVNNAVQSLEMALTTGRMQGLARATGVSALRLRAQPKPGLSQTQRRIADVKNAMKELTEEAEKFKDIPDTMEDMIIRLKVSWKDLFESFGKGFNKSAGTQVFIELLSGFAKQITTLEEAGASFGTLIGNGMAIAAASASSLGTVLASLWGVLKEVGSFVGTFDERFGDPVAKVDEHSKDVLDNFKKLHPAIYEITKVLLTFNGLLQIALETVQAIVRDTKNIIFPDTHKTGKQIWEEENRKRNPEKYPGPKTEEQQRTDETFDQRVARVHDQQRKALQDLAEKYTEAEEKLKKPLPGVTEKGNSEEQTAAQRIKQANELQRLLVQQAQERMQLLRENAKLELELGKERIDAEKADDNQAYRDGEESLKDHLEKQRQLIIEAAEKRKQEIALSADAEAALLKEKSAAQRDTLKEQLAVGSLTPTDYNLRLKTVNDAETEQSKIHGEKQRLQRVSVEEATQRQLTALAQQGDADRRQQRLKTIQADTATQTAAVKEQQQLNEKQFKIGEKTPEEYYNEKLDLIVKASQVETDAADATYQAGVKTAAALETRYNAVNKAIETAKSQIDLFKEDYAKEYLQYTERSIQNAQQPSRDRLAYLQFQDQLTPGSTSKEQKGAIDDLIKSTEKQITDLQVARTLTNSQSDTWADITHKIAEAELQLAKYNLQLANVKGTSDTVIHGLDTLGNAAGANFHSRFAQNLSQVFLGGTRQISESTRTGGTRDQLAKPAQSVTEFVDKMSTAVTAISDFTSNLLNAKSAIAGAFAGATGGYGLGNSLGGLTSGMSGIVGQLGQYGGAIGAAGGAIFGAVIGQKQAQVTTQIHELETSFRGIMQQFAQNQHELQQTMSSLTVLIAQAQSMKNSSKKGGSQYQQVIDQYNQQLIQLQNQQVEVIRNLNSQLAILRTPTGMQDLLSNLKSILDQYQQFEGAAANAMDLANANEYLVRSLQNYEFNLESQYNQDNQTAINDALSLNQLLYERQQLVNQLNTGVQSILSQGVLTRQRTFAETKGQQIAQLEYQDQQQLDQINQQISLTQFKLQSEQQIFNLATTKIGLEAQLLQLQENQASVQLANIQAMKDLLVALQSGNASQFGPLLGLLTSLPNVTNPAAGVGNSTALIEKLISDAYADRASLGYGGFAGSNL